MFTRENYPARISCISARVKIKPTQKKRTDLTACEKTQYSSFRGTLHTEKSLSLGITLRGIPHFVRNDARMTFSSNCEVCPTSHPKISFTLSNNDESRCAG